MANNVQEMTGKVLRRLGEGNVVRARLAHALEDNLRVNLESTNNQVQG